MIVLDATLRDGGYYNNWQFDLKLANYYLQVMEKARIHAVEVGFRSPRDNTLGLFGNVTDAFINEHLYKPSVRYFGVMVNTKEMTSEIINYLFTYSDESPINFVRVATHFTEVAFAERVCKDIKNLGYIVCCNLMQAADKSYEELQEVAEMISKWGVVDVLYIADSMGGMNHDAIDYAFNAIWSGWKGLTGFHGHNNKAQALNNSLEAVDIGVDWIDCTILGMGRGAGNTETEYLLTELNKRGFGEFELEELYNFAVSDSFSDLKMIYQWGSSLLYYLAAEYNIHPIYIQNMLANGYRGIAVIKAIQFLKDKKVNSFNEQLMNESLS